ncbi:MAG: hypothetical protein JWN32_147 [Solirubrobacterales bacterium]|nr:hypothetical protein [Solirubrobacterales bacterium]
MAAKIRLADGRQMTVAVSGKRVAQVLADTLSSEVEFYARFTTLERARVWINPSHVTAVEDRPEPTK